MKKKVFIVAAIILSLFLSVYSFFVTDFFNIPSVLTELKIPPWIIELFTPEWRRIMVYKVLNSIRVGVTILVFIWVAQKVVFRKIDFQKALSQISDSDKGTYAKCATAIVVSLIIAFGMMANSVHGETPTNSYLKYYKYIHGVCYEQYAYSIDCPGLTAAQIHQESLWNENARSLVGAEGLLQFIPHTWESEAAGSADIFDPYDSIRIGIRYQKKLYQNKKLNSYYSRVDPKKAFPHHYAAALASYNGDIKWVLKAMKKTKRQKGKSRQAWKFMSVSSLTFESQFPKHRAERRNYWRKIYRHYNRYYRSFGYPLISFPANKLE